MDAALISWFVIINPTSGNGSSKKNWPKIKERLELDNFNFQHVFTSHSKHSIQLVQQAIKQNIRNIICVGGDGTLHNIVNGIMAQNIVPATQINVGVIPIGTGNDWIKTFGISQNYRLAIKTIKNGALIKQDIGKIEFENNKLPAIYFNNLAGVGFDGYVVSKIEKHKQFGALAYLYGAVLSLLSFKNFESKVFVNNKIISGKTLMILVGICKYSGGGMQLTKNPHPCDGLFDITIAKNLNKFEIIKNLLNLFNGKITNHKNVTTLKSKEVFIEINQEILPLIQADGELIGSGSFKVSLVPSALSFYT
ncbi:MAG: diacylglycerol kinase family lipid kinase [Flaviramulus sp.]|nr:diacylglycerol kinase family protein [Flaviramulus sp.]NNC50133.1 diacylglycerol kinase family lipid kinase [Flaviramulus sp.]